MPIVFAMDAASLITDSLSIFILGKIKHLLLITSICILTNIISFVKILDIGGDFHSL